jgi:hypothetical protein
MKTNSATLQRPIGTATLAVALLLSTKPPHAAARTCDNEDFFPDIPNPGGCRREWDYSALVWTYPYCEPFGALEGPITIPADCDAVEINGGLKVAELVADALKSNTVVKSIQSKLTHSHSVYPILEPQKQTQLEKC